MQDEPFSAAPCVACCLQPARPAYPLLKNLPKSHRKLQVEKQQRGHSMAQHIWLGGES